MMKIVVAAERRMDHLFSAYAPQTGCSERDKDEFWSLLDEKTAEVPSLDVIIVAESHDLTIVNTKFRKRASHLILFFSGNTETQIDFVLVRNRDQGLVTDAKIVPCETVATQHRPLICTMKIAPLSTRQIERCGPARIKWLAPNLALRNRDGWRYLTGVLCDKKTPERLKSKIYRAVVRPVGIYGADCWPVTKEIERRLSVMETKMLWWTAGVTRLDGVRNDTIWQRFGVTSIVVKLREARLRWYGHVLRASGDTVGKTGLNFEVPGKRPRGRPK
ncbi:unnamed protein product [Heligmosomoides polygyrus]|uniref:Endonuclease-reverse transcriptase n=1 Tax=Heligmosomoides polygyrus TaxID=6339 RepID=A0A3P8DN52_HELPZ|nr:unnamed protein product [Heligmosomoides polygyrus]